MMRGRSASPQVPSGCSIPTRSRPAKRGRLNAASRILGPPRCAITISITSSPICMRDASGQALMSVAGTSQRIEVGFGPGYRAAVVYAPKGRDFICFEPMAGITDALNLAQRGLYTGSAAHSAGWDMEGDLFGTSKRVLRVVARAFAARRAAIILGVVAVGAGALTMSAQPGGASRATTIVSADLADGTGAALRRANVRFVNDRIVAVGTVKPQAGDTSSTAAGLVVAPGFIDIHNHSAIRPRRRSRRRDAGRAGDHDARRRTGRRFAVADRRLPGRAAAPRRRRSTCASLVGHATVRRLVMKDDYKRAARADEIARMARSSIRACAKARPGCRAASSTKSAATRDAASSSSSRRSPRGTAASTCRTSATRRTRASRRFREAIAIGEQAHVAVQISHIKLGTVGVWRKAARGVALIEAARAARRRRHRRRYPYDAWSSTITVLVPEQAVRRSAERREGARRRRRRGQRDDRPPRRASRVRVPDARGDRGGSQA